MAKLYWSSDDNRELRRMGQRPSGVPRTTRRPSQIPMQEYPSPSSCITTACGVPIVNGSNHGHSTSSPRSHRPSNVIGTRSIGLSSPPIRSFDSARHSFFTSQRSGPTSISPPGHSLSTKRSSQYGKRRLNCRALFTSSNGYTASQRVPDANVARTEAHMYFPSQTDDPVVVADWYIAKYRQRLAVELAIQLIPPPKSNRRRDIPVAAPASDITRRSAQHEAHRVAAEFVQQEILQEGMV